MVPIIRHWKTAAPGSVQKIATNEIAPDLVIGGVFASDRPCNMRNALDPEIEGVSCSKESEKLKLGFEPDKPHFLGGGDSGGKDHED